MLLQLPLQIQIQNLRIFKGTQSYQQFGKNNLDKKFQTSWRKWLIKRQFREKKIKQRQQLFPTVESYEAVKIYKK